ncbi:patatin-like phospholipase family protein [Coleofasciculus sp. FACHB-SPT36]|uniref:patatin-like phospholipase family protein n=1 Tax=Cyanophyceae TaxID=3028117 RepID=UPI00168C076B|nr:patatin-like phospholipase family protein [Coleofasciculus sp. FACHB-SPT36]MBD2538266.1 patatin-like phospholipase family protein [Coleofasciculus sp. FACHB-SPT36]
MTLNKLNLKRPKRLLSMDGGGIRGLIVVEILIKLEDILYNQPNSPWKCLADYFDFIGGTSAGAILAAGLAKGMSA